MPDTCPECGAPVPEGGSCQESFHALLALEGQVPGAPGSLVHFYTVGCYALQHPDSMRYTAEALRGLRTSLADALDGRAGVDELRRRAREAANGSARVLRREGDPPVAWRRGGWPMNVADVLAGGAGRYVESVLRWAAAIRETLDADERTGSRRAR
ncbi:MAG: DUF5946 family protein [Armatimonadota bacterium]